MLTGKSDHASPYPTTCISSFSDIFLCHVKRLSRIFSYCPSWPLFLQIFPFVTRMSSFSILIMWPKKWRLSLFDVFNELSLWLSLIKKTLTTYFSCPKHFFYKTTSLMPQRIYLLVFQMFRIHSHAWKLILWDIQEEKI